MQGLTRTAVWLTGILGAIGLLFYLFVFDVWTVPGSDRLFVASVIPQLAVQDLVLVRRGGTPGYGELARCASPTTAGSFVVGRVVGVAGESVEITDNRVLTNGRGLASRHACPQVIVPHPVTDTLVTMSCGVAETGAWSFEYLMAPPELSGGEQSANVEAGKLYLISDNRLMHQDSRDFGQVDASTCEHIVYRLWGEKFSDASRRFTVLW